MKRSLALCFRTSFKINRRLSALSFNGFEFVMALAIQE